MIGLVRLALRRPYTSAIAALLILLMGALSVTRMIVVKHFNRPSGPRCAMTT
jgi:hypothetical protein